MIIIFGPPGSGKSTQGKLLAQRLGCQWLSTGELLRQHLTGEQAAKQRAGELIEPGVFQDIFKAELDRLDAKNKELIVDGSPRTMAEAEWFKQLFSQGQIKLTAIIDIEIDKAAATARLLKRGRVDDAPQTIDERFNEYHNRTLPILAYFAHQGYQVDKVNGDQSPEAVAEDVYGIVNQRLNAS